MVHIGGGGALVEQDAFIFCVLDLGGDTAATVTVIRPRQQIRQSARGADEPVTVAIHRRAVDERWRQVTTQRIRREAAIGVLAAPRAANHQTDLDDAATPAGGLAAIADPDVAVAIHGGAGRIAG